MEGSSIAIVATGPRPGNTPIKVPSTAPPKAYSRFWMVKATPKPSARLCMRSMVLSSSADEAGPHGDRQLETPHEDHPRTEGEDDGIGDHAFPMEFVTGEA